MFIYMLFFQQVLFAQNEANIWYFGYNAGIDFNSGSAVPLTDGQLISTEGCATICDYTGKLLFYTNGSTIWNAKHEIMPNGTGLLGHESSSQSSIIIKKPMSSTIYYVFTVDAMGSDLKGLNYSEVDISLQGGLGDVNANKNISVVDSTSESITAIAHSNGIDFWIVTHIFNTNAFECYLLTSNGLSKNPVLNNIGNIVGGTGYLKASVDGSKIEMACLNYVSLFDFDNTTGVISNLRNINGFIDAYGVEFSPNGKILYVTISDIPSLLYQYDLLAETQDAINTSRVYLGKSTNFGGALQLAPDGKIYQSHSISQQIGVIENPNTLGVGCNYKADGFTLGGTAKCAWGLPNFLNSIFKPISFTYNNLCLGDSTFFTLTHSALNDSVVWDFGDENSGKYNTSIDRNPVHLYTDTGSFKVTLISFAGRNTDTITQQISINPKPNFTLGKDTTLCINDTFILDATTPNASYLWQDSTENPNLQVHKQDAYWVQVTVDNCTAKDTINITYDLINNDLGVDSFLCKDESITLDIITPNATYLWQDSTKSPTLKVDKKGTYWVEISLNNCRKSDTIFIDSIECDCFLRIANAFSPNADGINDGFAPVFDCDLTMYDFKVFNRWGEQIFETNNSLESWDGTFKGKDSPDGVYIYLISYRFKDKKMATKYESGYFTLVK